MPGWERPPEMALLLWPPLWSTGLAAGGGTDGWALLALILALILAHAALDVARPDRPADGRHERRSVAVALFAASLCFALPLGWAGVLVPGMAGLVMVSWRLRERSYLADPLLALGFACTVPAAWVIQGPSPAKATGLLFLAAALWRLAALLTVARPAEAPARSLIHLCASASPWAASLMRCAALLALWLAGRPYDLGIFFQLGLLSAAALTAYQFEAARRGEPERAEGLDLWWGMALYCGITFHTLCLCAS